MSLRLILASASPRRRELLARAGFRFKVLSPSIDETPRGESPAIYVRRLAFEKAQSCSPRAHTVVLAADTVVVLGRKILGKPRSVAEAARMLRSLSGRTHRVLTGTCVLRPGATPLRRVVATQVTFRALSPKEIQTYIGQGESMDKAGAYAAQGFGMLLLASIRGSYTNVIGLPMAEVLADLKRAGVRLS